MAKKSRKHQGGTPATVALTAAGTAFTVHSYDHDPATPSYGEEAAEALGVSPDRVFKTLVADIDGELTVAIVPVAGQLDLKALAAAVGAKRATMADPAAVERTTGYVRGGISPGPAKTPAHGPRRVGGGPSHDLCLGGTPGPGGRTPTIRPGDADRGGAGADRPRVGGRRERARSGAAAFSRAVPRRTEATPAPGPADRTAPSAPGEPPSPRPATPAAPPAPSAPAARRT